MKYKYLLTTAFLVLILFSFTIIYASDELNINSKSAIAIDADTLNILYDKNIDSKVYPASITKIMTAILSLENLDLNMNVTVSKTAINIPWDSSSIYLKQGEILTVEELLYGLLLNSGNDAANVLAEAVSGTLEDFAKLMNNKAKELGCTGTNFVNAHGYSHDDHYTTALDIVKIFDYCTKNEMFMKIISTKKYVINETNKTNSKRYLANTNRLILTKEESVNSKYYEYAIGGKTGYTNDAGRTLVTIGQKDGKKVIIAVFKAGKVNGEDARYPDAINLFEYSFNNYNKVIFGNNSDFNFIYTNYNNKLKYELKIKDPLELMIKNSEDIIDVSYNISLDEDVLQTLSEKDVTDNSVGTITFTINTNKSSYNVKHKLYLKGISSFAIINSSNYIFWIIGLTISGLLIGIIIFANIHKIKNKKKNKSKRKNRQLNHKISYFKTLK